MEQAVGLRKRVFIVANDQSYTFCNRCQAAGLFFMPLGAVLLPYQPAQFHS
jgi:hypothetical protein